MGNQVTVMVVPLAEENSLFRVSNHVVEDLRVEEEVVIAGRHSHRHLDNPYNFRLMSVYGHSNIKFSSKEATKHVQKQCKACFCSCYVAAWRSGATSWRLIRVMIEYELVVEAGSSC